MGAHHQAGAVVARGGAPPEGAAFLHRMAAHLQAPAEDLAAEAARPRYATICLAGYLGSQEYGGMEVSRGVIAAPSC